MNSCNSLKSFDFQSVRHFERDCRSMQDVAVKLWPAIEQLNNRSATIYAKIFPRPDGIKTGIIRLRLNADESQAIVRLPNFVQFNAIDRHGDNVTESISMLNLSELNRDGTVTVSNGSILRAITFKPFEPIMYEFNELDDDITRCALKFRPADAQRCYREISPEFQPGKVVLDFSKIAQTRLSDLKILFWNLNSRFPHVSQARIAQALGRAGFQFPRSPRR